MLGALHDRITALGFALAAVALAAIVVSFCYEVVARYFFSAPTEWASPLVSYSLVAMIFLAMPELTRRAAHIAINILLDNLRGSAVRAMHFVIRLVAAIACLLAAWFSGNETLNQFNMGIWTSPPFALPKWMVSVFVPYGMLSAGIYFVRQIVAGAPRPASQGASA